MNFHLYTYALTAITAAVTGWLTPTPRKCAAVVRAFILLLKGARTMPMNPAQIVQLATLALAVGEDLITVEQALAAPDLDPGVRKEKTVDAIEDVVQKIAGQLGKPGAVVEKVLTAEIVSILYDLVDEGAHALEEVTHPAA